MSEDGDNSPKKRRGGRPSQGKSGTFTFRVTAALRERLEADAKAIGRPVSEIIEYRLGKSYEQSNAEPITKHVSDTARWAASTVLLQVGPWQNGTLAARYALERICLELAISFWVEPLDDIKDANDRAKAEDCVKMAREAFAAEVAIRSKLNAGLVERLLGIVQPESASGPTTASS